MIRKKSKPVHSKKNTSDSTPTVLITGGSSGIGKEFSKLFLKAGYRLLIVSLDKSELTETKKELTKISKNQKIETLELDLTSKGSGQKLYAWTKSLDANVDILVNNAGFGLWGETVELSLAEIQSMLNLNVISLTELCSIFGKKMKERGGGSILNVASTASFQPLPFMAAYAASKSYVVSFSEALAEELSPFGVEVSILFPGTTRTNFLSRAGIHAEEGKKSLGTLAYRIAMEPSEVARIGFEAVLLGKSKAIPGTMNYLHFLSTKIFPRFIVRSIAGKIFQKK
ncbi:short-chain dehydrogenase [Leptospira perolatii]|uniref:Short-chain dehydrogenase n=1 Tax=Leptospira perolatii TaxID=2023191 RepID=A0A2M9ZSU1_9LEPT|nr:SDR family oxidoreductase [Leptospira perolatii]PJZ71439.1 short-chain dehydrogenase [Leptospira perolatii]PJZ74973.1 short-chain dehydrogenase [Leptospira perolatii]